MSHGLKSAAITAAYLPIFTPFSASQLRRLAETGTTLEALLLVWQAFFRTIYLP